VTAIRKAAVFTGHVKNIDERRCGVKKTIEKIVRESSEVKHSILREGAADIERAARLLIASLKNGGKVLVFGNGGSAADSQHMAAELVGRFRKERKGLPAIALTANTSALTAIANDYGYDFSFSRQVEAIGKKGDIAVGISTSGNSRNVIEAVKKAKALGLKTVGIAGCGGGALAKEVDAAIALPSTDTPRVQESHIMIIHILCELIEEELFGSR
jgi:D-sedoheptulose 7-phosphate isomerase